jgi:hypothetical protein
MIDCFHLEENAAAAFTASGTTAVHSLLESDDIKG